MIFLGGAVVYRSATWIWVPAIRCREPILDVGEVRQGERVPCLFEIRNSGLRPLSVERVKPGCGACFRVMRYPGSPLMPGEGGVIELELITDKLTGDVRRTIMVDSNDPQRPRLLLEVHGDVIER